MFAFLYYAYNLHIYYHKTRIYLSDQFFASGEIIIIYYYNSLMKCTWIKNDEIYMYIMRVI